MPKYPSPEELEVIYAERDAAIEKLGRKAQIEISDLQQLDRIGRFKTVCQLWQKCSPAAQEALRNDQHHSVRSAAVLAK